MTADYEEGVWTPTLTFGDPTTGPQSVVYNFVLAKYIKVGKLCSIHLLLDMNVVMGPASGAMFINGLPYECEVEGFGALQFVGINKTDPGFNYIAAESQRGLSRMAFPASGNGRSFGSISAPDIVGGRLTLATSVVYVATSAEQQHA